MKIIGITGGIGSGKSVVAGILKNHKIPVVDADEISRGIVFKGGPALEELVEALGTGILDADQNFDRHKVAGLVFSDETALETLNTILHRHIIAEMRRQLSELESEGVKIAAIDVPLPVKVGFVDVCDEIWTVDAEVETRIERLIASRGYTREQCLERMKNQPTPQEYVTLADKVFYNNGSLNELKADIEKAIQEFKKLPTDI